ncbi:MAG TPA: GGDEF domain-containing protein [Ilumatobacter sp.]|nr:GGDEF domain-containing protein [Ilumatobacter sp.]
MKLLRRLALVLSLGLVVAVTVAYVARHSEASNSRDIRLSTAAEAAANEVTSLVRLVEVAVRAGGDPATAADSISQLVPHLSVCVADSTRVECSGERPDGVRAAADEYQADFGSTTGDAPHANSGTSIVSVFDRMVTIDVVGNQLAAVLNMASDDLFAEFDTELWVTADAPQGRGADGFVVDGDIRQTFAPISGTSGLVVVASGPNSASVSSAELTFYVVLGGLAVLLMLLAGATSMLAHRSLLERASIDQLTRLPNRGEFERLSNLEIAASERTGVGFALLLFDLNGFKSVNDNYGHQAGDELLQIVAERLQHATRESDLVARWGGDEFVVLMPGVVSAEMGGRRARQMADSIAGRARLDSAVDAIRVKASVGVAMWPTNGTTILELMAAADTAMYHAKRHQLVAAIAGDVSIRSPSEFALPDEIVPEIVVEAEPEPA